MDEAVNVPNLERLKVTIIVENSMMRRTTVYPEVESLTTALKSDPYRFVDGKVLPYYAPEIEINFRPEQQEDGTYCTETVEDL